ncbi:MAG: hypothetical protein ACLQM8_07445 [Limisphaerales bacterium]
MRTKVLICAAALAAASAFTTMAQNVYSLNVVGYININLVEGFNLVANQLDFDGTGLNNTPANVLSTNLPLNSSVYGWANDSWNIAHLTLPRGATTPSWSVVSGSMPSMNPGQGVWLSIPSQTLSGTSSNVTVVGQVNQGVGLAVNTNLPAAGGFGLLSSVVPIAGGITTVMNYAAAINDEVYQWNPGTPSGTWTINHWTLPRGATSPSWSLVSGPTGAPAEPTLAVGQGFWLSSSASSVWSNYFIVQ